MTGARLQQAPRPAQECLNFEGMPFTHAQQFAVWKEKPGAKYVLRDFYRLTASYVKDWQKTGIPVSATLVFELLRYRMQHVYSRAERMKVSDAKLDGYSLPNSIRPYVARHYMEHKPEHKGLFEIRAVGMERSKKRVIVIESKPKAK